MEKKVENKYSYLLKNIGILTLSNFGSKILTFLLIPLYTSVLTTSEYGTYDLYTTTLSLFIPILTLNIVDGVVRFSMDNEYNCNSVLSIGIKYILKSILCFFLIILLNHIFGFFKILDRYWIFLFLMYVGNVIYDLLIRFARSIDKVKDVAIVSFFNTVITLFFNILFLLVLKWGLIGYFSATILAYLFSILYLSYKLSVFDRYSTKSYDANVDCEMVTYSKPLIVDTLSWWITNASDRYIIILLVGVAANGIYSLAYKIPSVLNLFQSIFMQAWILSAVKEFDKNNSKFYSDIYNIYNAGMVIVCSLLIICDKLIARILFAKEFYGAWQYAPLLMISVLFGSLCAVYNGIFNAAKQSKLLARTTFFGAFLNVIGNLIFVKIYGPIGAAISTLLSYFTVWALRTYLMKNIIILSSPYFKQVISYFVLIIQCIVLIKFNNLVLCYIFEVFLFILIVILYKKDILKIFIKLFRRIK